MKKFYRRSVISALVIIGIGMALCIVGAIGGGLQTFITMTEEDGFSFNPANKFKVSVGKHGVYIGDDDSKEYEKSYTFSVKEDGIKSIECVIGVSNVTIENSGDEDKIYVEVDGDKRSDFSCKVENETLVISCEREIKSLKGLADIGCDITLQLPETEFEKMKLDVGAGNIEADTLKAKQMEIVIGAGNVELEKIKAKELKGNVDAGNLSIDQLDAQKEIQLEVNAGRIEVDTAKKSKEITVECNMGEIEMELQGEENDYNIDLSCAMGNVSVGDYEIAGMDGSKNIDNDATNTINAECNLGNINIYLD